MTALHFKNFKFSPSLPPSCPPISLPPSFPRPFTSQGPFLTLEAAGDNYSPPVQPSRAALRAGSLLPVPLSAPHQHTSSRRHSLAFLASALNIAFSASPRPAVTHLSPLFPSPDHYVYYIPILMCFQPPLPTSYKICSDPFPAPACLLSQCVTVLEYAPRTSLHICALDIFFPSVFSLFTSLPLSCLNLNSLHVCYSSSTHSYSNSSPILFSLPRLHPFPSRDLQHHNLAPRLSCPSYVPWLCTWFVARLFSFLLILVFLFSSQLATAILTWDSETRG